MSKYKDIYILIDTIDYSYNNMRSIILKLKDKFKDKKLPDDISDKVHKLYALSVNENLITLYPEKIKLYNNKDELLFDGYIDMIIGDYGIWLDINFSETNIGEELDKYILYSYKSVYIYKYSKKVSHTNFKLNRYYVNLYDLKYIK